EREEAARVLRREGRASFLLCDRPGDQRSVPRPLWTAKPDVAPAECARPCSAVHSSRRLAEAGGESKSLDFDGHAPVSIPCAGCGAQLALDARVVVAAQRLDLLELVRANRLNRTHCERCGVELETELPIALFFEESPT